MSFSKLLKSSFRRISSHYNPLNKQVINDSKDVIHLTFSDYKNGMLEYELFTALFLNYDNEVVETLQYSQKNADSITINGRAIYDVLSQKDVSSVYFIHNHPDGICYPSKEDKVMTQSWKQVCASINTTLVDHLILTPKYYYSFRITGNL